MKAVLFDSPGKIRIAEVPDPVIGLEEILVAVKILGTFALLHTASAAIEMLREKKINAEAFVSHRFSLEDFTKAMSTMKKAEHIKIIIEPYKSTYYGK